jgi:hypothetical protein
MQRARRLVDIYICQIYCRFKETEEKSLFTEAEINTGMYATQGDARDQMDPPG